MSGQEQDHRLSLLNSVLTTPHRELDKIYPIHKAIVDSDPIFYAHFAAWYMTYGEVRDHKEMFIINLCMQPDSEFRNTGLALLSLLPPFQVTRVVDFIHKNIKKNVPRSMVTEITNYLRVRENDPKWFDQAVLNARKSLKRLYSLLHISPSDRAQNILFEDNPPADSSLSVLKAIARETNPSRQAELIIENKIPYRIAASVVVNMTPTVMLALIESMSSQELINNMGALKERGVFDNPDLKEVVQKKLNLAKKSKNVAAMKSLEAVKATNLTEDLVKNLTDIADAQVKSKGRIKRPTAILVDKSHSLGQAIEIGKQLGSLVSSVMDAEFYCYAFDVMPYEIKAKGTDIAAWNEAFKHIRAGGGTSCGCAIAKMQREKQRVEQIILVSDEGDNTSPYFTPALTAYSQAMGVRPNVFILRCGNPHFRHTICRDTARQAGFDVDDYLFEGDYYSLPNIIPFLTKPSKLELLFEILDYPLPQRKKYEPVEQIG